jgi:LacI family transcriptional regulator
MSVALILRHSAPSEMMDPYFSLIHKGIEEEAAKWRIRVERVFLIQDAQKDWSRLADFGAVITVGVMCESVYQKIKSINPNLIIVDDYEGIDSADLVLTDFYKRVKDSLEELDKAGHKNITYIGGKRVVIDEFGERHEAGRDTREVSYYEWMMTKGYSEYINVLVGKWNSEGGLALTRELLNSDKPLPTAILVGSDPMAMGVYRGLQESGIKIPEQVSIISFDDVEMAKFLTPTLSSVRSETLEMGKTAIRLAKERIIGERTVPMQAIFPSKLILRESFAKNER